MSVLCVSDLSKSYRKIQALRDVSFEIEPGEFVGLIGPNGAGKSTLMNCTVGRIAASAGQVKVHGIDVAQSTVEARRHIGFVPQDLDMHGYLTGEEYLRFVSELRGSPNDAEIEDLLALTELTTARHRVVKEYSGGMERKLAIAAALVGAPPLLILDESFVGLDPESTFRIRQRLEAHREAGGAVLLSSHILDMLERVCTRIIMLVGGEKVLDEPMDNIKTLYPSDEDLTHTYLRLAGKMEVAG
ncbi:MAG: ABC transporter ATP-binding protein [bacterium]